MEPIITKYTRKCAIITGSNDGIGKEMAKVIAKEVETLVMGCRDLKKAELAKQEIINASGNNNVIIIPLDLASFESVRNFVDEFNKLNLPLDILVNNSGVMMPPYSKTVDGFGYQFQINHLGPSLLTYLLLNKLSQVENPRVLMLSSKAHIAGKFDLDKLDIPEKDYSPLRDYGFTKLCSILFAKEMQRIFNNNNSKIIINSIHPGIVKTSLGRELNWFSKMLFSLFYNITTEDSGKACARVALGNDDDLQGVKGEYFDTHKVGKPSKIAQDSEIASKFWIKTAEMLKIDPEIKF